MLAVKNIKTICEEHLTDNYSLEIIDVYQQPELAQNGDLIAAPTLIKSHPEPVCKIIGDLSDTSKVLSAIGIAEQIDRGHSEDDPSQGTGAQQGDGQSPGKDISDKDHTNNKDPRL